MTLRALYICYLSLDDPLVHSQVVAYLAGLREQGHTVHLLTFDTELPAERREQLRADLARRGIPWHSLRYHKRPSLPATVYDVLAGAVAAVRIMRRHGLNAVHARNHVPGAMGLVVARLTGCRLIFDLRGLMAEEYADAGTWRRGGLPYRITNWIQRVALARADGIVVLTDAVRRFLFDGATPAAPVAVIPCCAVVEDSAVSGDGVRDELALGGRPVMVYVGKFTGWYMEREMVDFFRAARERFAGLHFLVLTQSDRAVIEAEFRRAEIPGDDYTITRVAPAEVLRYVAAADFGIAFVRPSFSKISSSPTKVGEYLAAGVPVLATPIGDLPDLLRDRALGTLVDDFSEAAYAAAGAEAERLVRDAAVRERCRAAARDRLSLQSVGIPRYDGLYREVAGRTA